MFAFNITRGKVEKKYPIPVNMTGPFPISLNGARWGGGENPINVCHNASNPLRGAVSSLVSISDMSILEMRNVHIFA